MDNSPQPAHRVVPRLAERPRLTGRTYSSRGAAFAPSQDATRYVAVVFPLPRAIARCARRRPWADQPVSRRTIMPSVPRLRRQDAETGPRRSPAAGAGRRHNCSRTRQSWWFSVTMGGMSASDAAPLPRLGEVFFDVRGNSRSMRLSWYADTGVAILSIWQGGMCTGTFRLAIADLPRMVETLQHGPGGQRPQWDSEAPGQAFAQVPRVATATGQVQAMQPLPGQGLPDQDYRARSAQYETQYLTEAPGDPRAGTGEPPRHGTVPPDYLAEPSSGRRPAPPSHRSVPPGYLPDDPRTGATPRPGEPPEYLPTPEYPPAPPEYLPAPPDHRTR